MEVEMKTGGIIAIVIGAVIIVAAAAWLGLGYVFGQATGGEVVTEERPVSDFTQVDVSGEGTLIVTLGTTTALRVEGPEELLDRIETDVDGDTLHIGERWSWLRFSPFWDSGEVTYHLTVPELTGVELSGSVTLRAESSLQTEELAVECSGSSDIDLDVQLSALSVDISGSADVTLRGSADSATYSTSGSSNIGALDLSSRTVTIDCSGSSNIEVNASEQLTIDISGSGTVSYLGNPALDTDISGSGEVKQLEQ
jgi:hypothetical protein